MKRILLIEDDQRLAELISEYLCAYEFETTTVARGDIALEAFRKAEPDAVILDLMLPGLDGMIVCRQIRAESNVPILILTARGDDFDEVSGLEQGADDYVNKPVQPRILLARLRALLRRTAVERASSTSDLVFDGLSIARADRRVSWRGREVALSTVEFRLLLILAESAGETLTREAIQLKLRGYEPVSTDRSIDNLVSRLRRKLDDADAERIKTVWGEGYLFSPSSWR